MEFLKNAGGLVHSQAAFYFGTCAGRRSNFFSSPSDCRCALSLYLTLYASPDLCPVWPICFIFLCSRCNKFSYKSVGEFLIKRKLNS